MPAAPINLTGGMMISELEIYNDDTHLGIKNKINELIEVVNTLSLRADVMLLGFDNHTHEVHSDFTNRILSSGGPLVTMVDERESDRG